MKLFEADPKNVPSRPRKTRSPIIYLKISLLSSNLDETPSRIVPNEFADNEGLSFLFSVRTAATGARSVGFILRITLAGIKLSFLLINLSHLASLLKRKVCRNEKIVPKIKVLIITLLRAVLPSKACFKGTNKNEIKIITITNKSSILKAYLFGSVIFNPNFIQIKSLKHDFCMTQNYKFHLLKFIINLFKKLFM